MSATIGRRAFVAALAGGALAPGAIRLAAQQGDSLSGVGTGGTLRDPDAAGRPQHRVSRLDNDLFIQAVERRLKCQCGCNLDVFTCRTTDFSCGTSPRMHREVLALHGSGKDAQGIIDAFVAQYGEQVLMAPKPVGFNWLGYLLPGVLIVTGGSILALVLRRRIAGTPALSSSAFASPTVSASPPPTPEELESLRRVIADSEG